MQNLEEREMAELLIINDSLNSALGNWQSLISTDLTNMCLAVEENSNMSEIGSSSSSNNNSGKIINDQNGEDGKILEKLKLEHEIKLKEIEDKLTKEKEEIKGKAEDKINQLLQNVI